MLIKMKKLFYKRVFAYLIDGILFAFCYELLRNYIDIFIKFTGSWGYFLVFIPLIIRDVWFMNASLGKKILGLVVVDDNWLVPRLSTIVKRSAFTATLGFALLAKLKTKNYDKRQILLSEMEWECQHLKARVVEKKVYRELKAQALNGENIDVDVMNQLYYQHLGAV